MSIAACFSRHTPLYHRWSFTKPLFLIVMLNVVAMTSLSAQEPSRKDSIWAVWHDQTVPDSIKTKLMVRLAWLDYNEEGQVDSGIIVAKMAYDLAKSIGDKAQMSNALAQITRGYQGKGDYVRELNSATEGYELAIESGDSLRVAQQAFGMHNLYFGIGEESTAKEYLEQSLAYCLALEHDIGIGFAYSALSGYAYREENFQEAIRTSSLSVRHLERTEVDFKTFQSMCMVSITHSKIGQSEQALIWIYRMEEFIEKKQLKHWKDAYRLAITYGYYHRSKGEHEKAIEYFQQCLLMAKGDPAEGKTERYESSKELFETYALEQDYERAYAYKLMSEAYKTEMDGSRQEQDNLKKLYRSEFERVALQDSLDFVQQQAVAELQYETNLARRNYILFGGLGLALLAFMFFRYRQRIEVAGKEAEARRLQELDQVKNRLYTNITHEFRTPLTVIQGMSDKLSENPDKWLSNGLPMIKRNSQQLLGLVNQMLDLSKLESGKLELHPMQADMLPFLHDLVESFQVYAESKGITLHFSPEIESQLMDFDPVRMAEVLSNLLSNAIKFTPEGGLVDVRALADQENFMLIIKDNGIGIDADKLPHIFDRFYQADDSSTRQGEGTGVGLALTRELVQLMGGRIEVASQIGQGTEFTVLLPISQQTDLAEVQVQENISQGSLEVSADVLPLALSPSLNQNLPQILLIEDNADIRGYLISCLEADYRIEVARDGKEGIEKALELVPDLIISDVMMPYKDGFEVCYELKQDLRTSHIPVILLTAKADQDSKLTGLRRGADAYLTKPFNEEELFLRISNLLALRTRMQARYTGSAEITAPADTPEQEQEDAFIQQVRELVMQHLGNYQLDVPTLCKELGMTRTPLHNKLKALTGMSTTEFVRFVRLSKAKELLLNQELNVSEVAYMTGFQNHTYFSRKFKEVVGMTPKAWREGNI